MLLRVIDMIFREIIREQHETQTRHKLRSRLFIWKVRYVYPYINYNHLYKEETLLCVKLCTLMKNKIQNTNRLINLKYVYHADLCPA